MPKSVILEEEPQLERLSYPHKEVLFLPIHHIGLSEYYGAVRELTDSLEDTGYRVFYEQLSTNVKDIESYINLAKKFRKITGSFNGGDGYLDTLNNQLGDQKFPKKYSLQNQPPMEALGVNIESALAADLTLEDLIEAFEAKHAQVKLDSCDLTTPLDSSYACSPLDPSLSKDFQENFILGLRNAHLARLIHFSRSPKIYVIYGASHFEGLREELKKLDSDWN